MKYTFEIMKEYEDAFRGISVYSVSEDKKLMVDFVAIEELEDAQKEIDEAYQRGLEEGKKAFDLLDAERDSEYQRGLDDAWEAARRIIHMPEGDLLNIFTECYSAVCTALQVLLKYDASEAIEKLKAYEEKQKADDEIKVGDTVNIKSDRSKCGDGIVTKLWKNDRYYIMWADGSCGVWDKECVVKTGRHIDIDKILEEMKE